MEFGKYKDSIRLLNQKKSVNCYDCFCASPFVKYVLPSFLVVLLILTFTHFGLLTWLPLEDPDSQATCHLQPSYYVSCLPGRPTIPKDDCLKLGCCWREDVRACYHSYPSRYGYKVEDYHTTSDGLEGNITASRKFSPAGKPARDRLGFHVRQVDENNFRIVLNTDPKVGSYESRSFENSVKMKKLSDYGHLFDFLSHHDDEARVAEFSLKDNTSTKVLLHEPHFSLSIVRDADELILSTARGPLIMTDNYWELTLYLATGASLQGLAALQLNGTTNWIYNNENQTIKPILLALRSNVACQLDYQAPIEIQVLNGSNLVILRGISIPDSGLTLNLYSGSSPLQTISKLKQTSDNSQLLSFNRLGLHLCPDNHDNLKSAVDSLKILVNDTTKPAPWDSHCLSRRHLGTTLEHDTQLSLVSEAQRILDSRVLVAHLTPMLFNKGKSPLQSRLEKESCLLGNGTGSYIGMYASEGVVYPEWTQVKTHEIAMEYLSKYVEQLQLSFVVLRDAWPRDEIAHAVSNENFDYLPEGLRRLMSNGTVPFDLQNRRHYISHNAYSESFTKFVGVKGVELRGHECNSPNVEVNWSTLRSILEVGVVEAMTAQLPNAMYVCGANRARINDELCVRWYALAVTWPRILAVPEKSPFIGTRLSRSSAIQVANLLKLRATLTTYHRTTLASFARDASPIFADTSLYFPDDKQQLRYASQFLWGDSILVGVVLLPRHYQVAMWLPGEHPWKHMQGGSSVGHSINGSSIPVTIAMGKIALLVRPGRIVPVHEDVGGNSLETSLKNLILLANPICDSSNSCRAEGRVYFGNEDASTGDFLLIGYSNQTLALSNVLQVQEAACGDKLPLLKTFQILGSTNYTIGLNLCDLHGDVEVQLNGAQVDAISSS